MKSKSLSDRLWTLLFIGPALFIFATVVIVPFIMGIYYSFFSWDGIPLNEKVFIGASNYTRLFSDTRFISSGIQTVKFTIMSVIFINIFGIIFALIVTSALRTCNIARTMFFAPHLIGGLLLGFIWKFIFSNVFKELGVQTGIDNIFFNWLMNPKWAMYALILVNSWRMAGYVMIIYIAGIQSIPNDVIEAACVDGSNYINRLFRIIFPLLAPSITVSLFLTLSNSFKIYDVNLSLTGGGPSNTTELFSMNIFHEIFKANNYGYGQAKAIIFFIFVAAITLTQTYFIKKKEVEM